MNPFSHSRNSGFSGIVPFLMNCVKRRRTTPLLSAWFVLTIGVSALASGGELPHVVRVDADLDSPGDGSRWSAAFGELDDALDAARNSNGAITEVWVRASSKSYVPGRRRGMPEGDRDDAFDLLDGVAIFGGFRGDETTRDQRSRALFHSTVLSGDRLGDDLPGFQNRSDNCHSVLRAIDVGSSAEIDGFLIRSGMADVPGRTERGSGGGLYALRSSPRLRNCVFTDHLAFLGSAMAVWTDSRPQVRECRFEANGSDSSGGALYVFERSHALFQGCAFVANAGLRAAAVFNELSNPVFHRCDFDGNVSRTNGGAIGTDSGRVRFSRCRFLNNRSSDGAAIYANGELRVSDSLFTHNHAVAQGGAIVAFRDVVIERSTFASNEAGAGGAIWFGQAGNSRLVRDSILWANRDEAAGSGTDQIGGTKGAIGSLIRCCIEDLPAVLSGVETAGGAALRFGNFSFDPRFRNGMAGDYRLRDDSPCIDQGSFAETIENGSGLHDLDGRSRAVPFGASLGDSVSDIGAFEVQPAARYEAGNVATGSSIEAVDVLFVNGSSGGERRFVEVLAGSTIELRLDAPPGREASSYALWAWTGADRNPRSLDARGLSVGTLVNPTPVSSPDRLLLPRLCLRSPDLPRELARGIVDRPGPVEAPWVLRTSIDEAGVYTIQGLVADSGSRHPSRFSVTNAITLSVVEEAP